MTNFKLTPETSGYELYRYARYVLRGPLPEGPLMEAFIERACGWDLHCYARDVLQGPLPDGPLLDAFFERADGVDLWWHTEFFGPLTPKDPLDTL